MYCEISLKHRSAVREEELVAVVGGSDPLGRAIDVNQAHVRSVRCSNIPAIESILAHEATRGCFVILRSLSMGTSTFHLEGSDVPVQVLLEVARDYAQAVLSRLNLQPQTSAELLVIRLFEDSGKEIGIEGKPITFRSLLLEQIEWTEVWSYVTASFAAGFVLFIAGRSYGALEALVAAGAGLVAAVVILIVRCLWKYGTLRDKIVFEFRER